MPDYEPNPEAPRRFEIWRDQKCRERRVVGFSHGVVHWDRPDAKSGFGRATMCWNWTTWAKHATCVRRAGDTNA